MELSRRLQTDKVEVINAGVGAFVVEQEFIFIQILLQRYQPDMIVGLNGYNDLVTYALNRLQGGSYPLPPHHWRHFKVIEYNSARRSLGYRFKVAFANFARLAGYLDRELEEARSPWSDVPEVDLEAISAAFWNVIQDTHDFCRAKGIAYVSFLQPIRFYDPSGDTTTLTDEQRTLCRLYRMIEDGTSDGLDRHSLTDLFRAPPRPYTDDCHVASAGHAAIGRRMADALVTRIVLPWTTGGEGATEGPD